MDSGEQSARREGKPETLMISRLDIGLLLNGEACLRAVVAAWSSILGAEALLRVANAGAGVAEANLYPRITLSGTGGVGAVSSLISGGGFALLGASLVQPLFRGGQLEGRTTRGGCRIRSGACDLSRSGPDRTAECGGRPRRAGW